MERNIKEILVSQKKMLNRKNVANDSDDKDMKNLFIDHLQKVKDWLSGQKNIKVLSINYNTLIAMPEPEIKKITTFLNASLDKNKMINVINPELYRNRSC